VAGKPDESITLSFREEVRRAKQLGTQDFREYIERAITASTTENGVFGTKLHAFQTMAFLTRISEFRSEPIVSLQAAFNRQFPNTRYIFLTRGEKVKQAISYYRALMTDEWHRLSKTGEIERVAGPISFDQYGIKKSLAFIERSDAYWESYFKAHKLSPLRLTYEELVGSYESSIRRVLDFLGLPADVSVPGQVVQKMGDERAIAWEKEFLSLEKVAPATVSILSDILLAPY